MITMSEIWFKVIQWECVRDGVWTNHHWWWAYDCWMSHTLQFSLLCLKKKVHLKKKVNGVAKCRTTDRLKWTELNQKQWLQIALFFNFDVKRKKKINSCKGQQKGVTKRKKKPNFLIIQFLHIWKSVQHRDPSLSKYPHVLKKGIWVFFFFL